jgi:predicted transglutaminase-like cysteine proteinase
MHRIFNSDGAGSRSDNRWVSGRQCGVVGHADRSAIGNPAHQVRDTDAPVHGYTMFCLRYEDQCRAKPIFRGGPMRLTPRRAADLNEVNQTLNHSIIPEPNELGLAGEAWLINPDRGDCNDYAVSKRHELLDRGWPARALLLSEVVTGSGEHHLVLVVRTKSGDLVLDNMVRQIKLWSRAPYGWIRTQVPNKPTSWAAIAGRGV